MSWTGQFNMEVYRGMSPNIYRPFYFIQLDKDREGRGERRNRQ